MQNTGCREELVFRQEPLPGEGLPPWLALAAHMAGTSTWRSAAPPPGTARGKMKRMVHLRRRPMPGAKKAG